MRNDVQEIAVDIIASTAACCKLPKRVTISPYIVPEEGYCVAARVLNDKEVYNELEGAGGQFHRLRAGHMVVGVLGERRALKGYSGRLPSRIETGDVLHMLNLGGIIGRCTSDHPDLGAALRVEILGAVMGTREQGCRHVSINDHALDPVDSLSDSAPLVVVSGSAMSTGKTLAACSIIQGLTERGMHVSAAKLTGAALQRDVRNMKAHGARGTATFVDTGIVASTGSAMTARAKAVIAHLNEAHPDVIVLELGDGFVGYYGVDELLHDRELQRFTAAHVVTASDLAGAWAAEKLFRQSFRASITAMSGPVTDNEVGCQYLEQVLGIAAVNARNHPSNLSDCVAEMLPPSSSRARTSDFVASPSTFGTMP